MTFFPQTSKIDIMKSFGVIILLAVIAFFPTLLGHSGMFFSTRLGLAIFPLCFAEGIYLYWKVPLETESKVSQRITVPYRVLAILLSGFATAFVSLQLAAFNRLATLVIIATIASIIEIALLLLLSVYIPLIIVYILRRKSNLSSE